ncbi:MAG: hypothetical protein WCK29_04045 [archaeon]
MADDSSTGTVSRSNPDNAKANDSSYTQAGASVITSTHYLKATNFGFSIPNNATINGILVEIRKFSAIPSLTTDKAVSIIKSNGTIGTTNR